MFLFHFDTTEFINYKHSTSTITKTFYSVEKPVYQVYNHCYCYYHEHDDCVGADASLVYVKHVFRDVGLTVAPCVWESLRGYDHHRVSVWSNDRSAQPDGNIQNVLTRTGVLSDATLQRCSSRVVRSQSHVNPTCREKEIQWPGPEKSRGDQEGCLISAGYAAMLVTGLRWFGPAATHCRMSRSRYPAHSDRKRGLCTLQIDIAMSLMLRGAASPSIRPQALPLILHLTIARSASTQLGCDARGSNRQAMSFLLQQWILTRRKKGSISKAALRRRRRRVPLRWGLLASQCQNFTRNEDKTLTNDLLSASKYSLLFF